MIDACPTPLLLLLSAPSGAGKTTLCDHLREAFPTLHVAITATTRPPRPGEVDGQSYYFYSLEEFERRERAGAFFETAWVHGHRYGSPKAPVLAALEQGRDALLNLDVQGADTVRAALRQAPADDPLRRFRLVDIFVAPPSMEALQQRLRARGTDSAETIARRLERAAAELARWTAYSYLVVNDDLPTACAQLQAIVRAEHCRIRKDSP